MVLTLTDDQSGTSLELYQAQSLSDDRQAAVNAAPATGTDSEEAFLSSLQQDGTATLQGVVTGPRLTRAAGFSTDPITALAQWAATLEVFVNGAPGEGQTLTRGYRGDAFSGVAQDVQWTRRGGEPLELGYNVTFVRGDSLSTYTEPSVDVVSPGGAYSVAGRTLDTLEEFAIQKQQSLSATRRTFADSPDENDLTTDAGATRRVTITGRVAGDETVRNQFDADLTATLGQDEIISVVDAFTGRTYEGMVTDYTATDEAGAARLGDFGVEILEGVT